MQTFSKMQRNRIAQKNLGYFFAFIFLAIYCFLGDIFIFLPPLFGIMFVLFSHSIRQRKNANLALIFVFLLWIECDRGLPFGTLTVVFVFYYFLIFNPVEFWVRKTASFLYILLLYLGLFILFAFLGSYGEALEWKKFFGLCVYYAVIEGVISRAIKI